MADIPGLTDTHCHLNDPAFDGRIADVLARAHDAGVERVIVPGWDRESSERALALADEFPEIRPAVGLHPWMVTADADLTWVAGMAADARVVAIGEIGLDGAVAVPIDLQEPVFRAQLALAIERNLPALIHCRKAWEQMLVCLHDYPGLRGILHAFNGSVEVMRECVTLRCYFGYGGGLTRPNNRRAHQTAAVAPADRLLLETDAPSIGLEGVPSAEVEPRHIVEVLARLAELRDEEPDKLTAQIAENTDRLFHLWPVL